MRKILLTIMLLAFTMMVGAATQGTQVKTKARPNKTAPLSLKRLHTQNSAISKAPRKDAEDGTDVTKLTFTIDEPSFHWFDDGDASFWYWGCNDDTYQYILRIAYNTESQTGTINYSDLNLEYSYMNYTPEEPAEGEEAYQEITFLEGTNFTIAEDEQYLTVTGTIIGSNSITYSVNARYEKPQPQTYDIEGSVITQADYYEESKEWYVRFKDANDNWKITLDLISKAEDGSFAGTYTMDDAYDADYCFAEDMNEDEDYNFTDMNVTVTMPEDVTDPKKGCEITGWGKDKNGNVFNFHMKKEAPIQPKETKEIEVEVKTAEWPSERNVAAYYEVTEKGTANLWTLALQKLTGTCTLPSEDNMLEIDTLVSSCKNTETGDSITINNGTVTQTLDAQNMTIATQVDLVMSDSILYKFTFDIPINQKGEETLNFTDLNVDTSSSEWGYTSLDASTDNIALSVALTDYAQVPGEYIDENCSIGIDKWNEGESAYTSCLALVNAYSEITEENTPHFVANFLGDDMKLYHVDASYITPKITDEITINAPEANLSAYADDGFYFDAVVNDTSIWIKVSSDQIEGHFTTEVDANSYISYTTESGMTKTLRFINPELTVTHEGKTYQLTGTTQAGKYKVNLNMTYTIPGYDYDNYEDDADDLGFSNQDLVEITADEENRCVYLKLINKEWNDELCMVFFPEEFNGTTIPAGDYEITSYGWGNYVQAGSPSEEGIYPSFYAKLDAEGNVKTPLWFLYSGTVTVGENNSFEVNAKNSFGRTILATVSSLTEINYVEVDNNIANAQKILQNGKIIIRNVGVEYNLSGQRR